MIRKFKDAIAWAWAFDGDDGSYWICAWSHPDRSSLERERKPSPEAFPVMVHLAPVYARRRKGHAR